MKLALTDKQKAAVQDPQVLSTPPPGLYSAFLERYIILQHFIAKYELQVHAYGPFRRNTDDDNTLAREDNERMERDFTDEDSFKHFLMQVRLQLWMMEDDFINKEAKKQQ